MSVWKYDYARQQSGVFWDVLPFDLAVFDVTDPEKLLSLTFMDQPNKNNDYQ